MLFGYDNYTSLIPFLLVAQWITGKYTITLDITMLIPVLQLLAQATVMGGTLYEIYVFITNRSKISHKRYIFKDVLCSFPPTLPEAGNKAL